MDVPDRKVFSRRSVLAGAAGLAALSISGLGFINDSEAKTKAKAAKVPEWPWPYVKLDPARTAETAYNEWYRLYCGGAVISSVFGQLKEKVGQPYASFPVDAFFFLEGGISGWGTICGSNAGANLVSNLIIGSPLSGSNDGMLMGSELMQWYSDAEMPVFVPKEPKVKAEIAKTVSESPLCHISVGRWMKATGKGLNSPERKDRCARVAASVSYRLVELLNDWKDGKYETAGLVPSECGITAQNNCNDCHGMDVPPIPPEKTPVTSSLKKGLIGPFTNT